MQVSFIGSRALKPSLKSMAIVVFSLCYVTAAETQTSTMSADDTATFINTTLHKYPTLEFVDSGCSGHEQVVGIASDRRSLLIKQNFGKTADGKCDNVATITAPIFSLNQELIGGWSKQAQHTSFFLDCTNRVDCFSRQSEAHTFASAENTWYLQLTAPDQVSDQLTKAIRHLVEALLTEANMRVDRNNPFARHVH